MTKKIIVQEYLRWLHSLVGDDPMHSDYNRLFEYLFHREFLYLLGLDSNRAVDGIDLRYRFLYEHNFGRTIPVSYVDDRPCSVLEMMVALSMRCESIMYNPDAGDRTDVWFWDMITNLGLENMTDDRFDKKYVDKVITRFLNRKYSADGKGGLFTIKDCKQDLRTVELWYQAMWYLDNYISCERSM